MIQIGSIVTVIWEDHYFKGFQGEVVEIKKDDCADGIVGVRFGKNYEDRTTCSLIKSKDGIFYLPIDILREDEEFTSVNRAGNVFALGNWVRIMCLKDPINKQKLCKHKDCEKTRRKRILVNIWGTVFEVDVCDDHADVYHGKCIDEFPERID